MLHEQFQAVYGLVRRMWKAYVRMILYVNVTNLTGFWRRKVRQLLPLWIPSVQ